MGSDKSPLKWLDKELVNPGVDNVPKMEHTGWGRTFWVSRTGQKGQNIFSKKGEEKRDIPKIPFQKGFLTPKQGSKGQKGYLAPP